MNHRKQAAADEASKLRAENAALRQAAENLVGEIAILLRPSVENAVLQHLAKKRRPNRPPTRGPKPQGN